MVDQQVGLAVLLKRMSCSMTAGLIAGAATNPVECVRVRWQVMALSPGSSSATTSGGLLRFAADIIRREGLVGGLWRPGCLGWMASFGGAFGIRMGIYERVRLGLERAAGLQR